MNTAGGRMSPVIKAIPQRIRITSTTAILIPTLPSDSGVGRPRTPMVVGVVGVGCPRSQARRRCLLFGPPKSFHRLCPPLRIPGRRGEWRRRRNTTGTTPHCPPAVWTMVGAAVAANRRRRGTLRSDITTTPKKKKKRKKTGRMRRRRGVRTPEASQRMCWKRASVPPKGEAELEFRLRLLPHCHTPPPLAEEEEATLRLPTPFRLQGDMGCRRQTTTTRSKKKRRRRRRTRPKKGGVVWGGVGVVAGPPH